jgi:polyhydroxyalkanoate synthesis regulator phasin
MAAAKKKTTGKARSGGKRKSAAQGARRRRPAAGRSDKSVEAFRDALDRNLTVSRERLQEVFDDAVRRGRMTRGDAEELVSNLLSHGRQYTDDLVSNLEKLLEQARKEAETRTAPARRAATQAAGRVARGARDLGDTPLARADQMRRRAGGPGFPISAYDQLTATQVKSRLKDLSKADLRKVRTKEKNGKGRKGILTEIEKRLK